MIKEKTGVPNPVRYELIDKDGHPRGPHFETARECAELAARIYPDQEQDPDRTGKGWDIQVSRASHYS